MVGHKHQSEYENNALGWGCFHQQHDENNLNLVITTCVEVVFIMLLMLGTSMSSPSSAHGDWKNLEL